MLRAAARSRMAGRLSAAQTTSCPHPVAPPPKTGLRHVQRPRRRRLRARAQQRVRRPGRRAPARADRARDARVRRDVPRAEPDRGAARARDVCVGGGARRRADRAGRQGVCCKHCCSLLRGRRFYGRHNVIISPLVRESARLTPFVSPAALTAHATDQRVPRRRRGVARRAAAPDGRLHARVDGDAPHGGHRRRRRDAARRQVRARMPTTVAVAAEMAFLTQSFFLSPRASAPQLHPQPINTCNPSTPINTAAARSGA